MKRMFTIIFMMAAIVRLHAQTDLQKVDALLKKMTIEEKVGQMTQVTIAVISQGGWGDTEGNIDPAALKKALADYHVGSILNVNAHGFTVDKWRQIITQIQDDAIYQL